MVSTGVLEDAIRLTIQVVWLSARKFKQENRIQSLDIFDAFTFALGRGMNVFILVQLYVK